MSLLEASGITLTAQLGELTVDVLRDISFTLERGETLGLVGESGAGKSMVGRLCSQLLPPGFAVSAGTLLFEGEDLVRLGAQRRRALLGKRIAFVPQEPMTALNPVLSIASQFDEHLRRLGVGGRAARRRHAIEMLSAVHLPEPAKLLAKYPHELSGGMCQRVLIAMAFAGDPALVVADEPTTALDVITQARIMALIKEMQAMHRTAVVLITHDLRLAAHVCDTVLVMYAGDIVEQGDARTLLVEPKHPYTRSLQRANPNLTGPRRRLPTLPDHMPGLAEFGRLPGCRFAPRCPVRAEACEQGVPALVALTPGHHVRCAPACAAGGDEAAAETAPPAPLAAHGESESLIALESVSRRFTTRATWLGAPHVVDAVREVDLTVRPGEFVGIVGESGSGKTTVARMIAGLDHPTDGRLLVRGRETSARDEASRRERLETLQMVFQDPQSALNPRRTVLTLLTQAMEADRRRHRISERGARAAHLLREIGMAAESARRYPSQLSGGQRQRVNIGRALCVAPKLLVADEIVSGLDVSVQAQILNLLLRLREELSISLLLISHDLSVVRYVCSRVLVMQAGRVVESGSTDAVFEAPKHPYTRALLAAVPPDDPAMPWPPGPDEAFPK